MHTTPTSSPIARPLFIPFTSFELDMLTLDQIQTHIRRYDLIIDWLKGEAFAVSDTELVEDLDEAANLLGLIRFNLESWEHMRHQPVAQLPARMAA